MARPGGARAAVMPPPFGERRAGPFGPTAGERAGQRSRPMLIGLTGPIGCGKSTVARILGDLGGTVIDADALAREATAPGEPAEARVRTRFGERVIAADGSLDRRTLASIVFRDPDALRDLESIVHPEVRRRVGERLTSAAADGAPFVVVEAIKLVEGGLAETCDEVWLIGCEPSEQRSRLAARGMGADDVERRIAAQGPDLVDRLASAATRRIDTSGDPDAVRERVEDALADALQDWVADA